MISVEHRRVEHLRRGGDTRWLLETLVGEEWLRLEASADLILTSDIYAGVPLPEAPGRLIGHYRMSRSVGQR